jgi:hypothetical protein
LFGETVYGTYEIAQFKEGDTIIEMPLIKSQSREGDYVVLQIDAKKNRIAQCIRINSYDMTSTACGTSIREAMERVIEGLSAEAESHLLPEQA